MDNKQDTLELLMKVGPYMQNDPRYVFDQPEYHMSEELREFAKAKSKEFRKDRGEIEMPAAQFKRQQLEKSRNAYKKAKENGTTKAL